MLGIVTFANVLIAFGIRNGSGDKARKQIIVCRMGKNQILFYLGE